MPRLGSVVALLAAGAGSGQSDGYLASCLGAQVFQNDGKYCDFATWTSALIWKKGNMTYFNPSSPLTLQQQNAYAQTLFTSLAGGKDATGDCGVALQRLACVTAFPKCSVAGASLSSISYYAPCRLQCEQVNLRCPSSLQLSCGGYATKDCFLYVPPGYFVLPPSQGPFDALPVLYATVLAIWLVFTALWNYWAFVVEKNSCVMLCRVVAGVPALKCVVLIFGVSFWSTCVSWDMCSFWMSVSLINTHLVFETGEIVLFLLIAKGWSITRETFHSNEWRGVILAMSFFYMCNSIIIVLQQNALTPQEFWISTAVLYGIMYLYILKSAVAQIWMLADQVSSLSRNMPANLTTPLKKKLWMYVFFLVLVLVSMLMEVYAQALIADSGKLWLVLVSYEVSNVLILGTMGWIFRPRQFSPFFFMVPARMTENGVQRIPFLEISASPDHGSSADDSSAIIELAPLIQPNAQGGSEPNEMVVICEPTLVPTSKFSVGLK